ncbi:hypothetical protein CAP35_07715 [Chitinophagaceae bacterium IBVUCB1]|nr:hypothetical protein CAP35_07715 [Chitinophagaceae bacterium IBVUCB1]
MQAAKRNEETGAIIFSLYPLSVKQLSEMYGIGIKTFRKWLKPFEKEIGEKNGHYYTISQVRIIVQKLGIPGSVYSE